MTVEIQQIAVLIAFALVLLLINLKADGAVLKVITYVGLWASVLAAGYLIVEWVFL